MFITRTLRQEWRSAGQLAQHLLQQNGPQTTQQLFKLSQAVHAPAEKEYLAPHHRDYRIVDGIIRGATVRPPNPKHLVRSVRYLKQVLQGLEATSTIGHMSATKWINFTSDPELADLHDEAKALKDKLKSAGESEYIWIDGERFHRARPFNKPGLRSNERTGTRMPFTESASTSGNHEEARGL